MNESKEQKIFTNIRSILNDREDELLLEVDNKYNELLINKELIKDSEKLPNKIKLSIEKGKAINNKWDDINQLNNIITDCINIENNINLINNNIDKLKLNQIITFNFTPDEELLDEFIQKIKSFGNINKFDSLILNNIEDINKFYNLVSKNINLTSMKLLYRSTRDGLELQNIKNKINNKFTLIL